MNAHPTDEVDRCPIIAVLADIDPDDRLTHLDGDVIRRQFERRLGPCVFVLRTVRPSATPLRHTAWTPTPPTTWAHEVDVVIVDRRIDAHVRNRSGITANTATVDTTIWELDTPLAALFTSTADPAALDARERMLDHLGLTTFDDVDEHVALGALDLAIMGVRGQLDGSDPRVAALLAGPTSGSDEIDAQFDELAARVGAETGRRPSGAATELARQLTAERRERFLDQHLALERLDEMGREIERLQHRLEAMDLRAALAGDIGAP